MSADFGIFSHADAAAVVAGILTVILSGLALDGPHWERRVAASVRDHEIRSDLTRRFYEDRPAQLYIFVPYLALRVPISRRTDRFRLRAERAANLPEQLKAGSVAAARQWLSTVGAFAEEAARSRVDLRPFLATYHLGVIREGVIAVPIAMSMMAERKLTADEFDRLGWGLALVELAVVYNSHARQQRAPIYFAATGHEPPIGPVLRAPANWRRKAYDVVEFLDPPLRLPRWGRWRWGLWLRTIDVGVPQHPGQAP